MSISEGLIKSLHRGKWNGTDLVIDKSRSDEHGEVFTPSNIVSDMLDLLSDEYQLSRDSLPIDKTFLEPSCGTGNFLVQILERKLQLCSSLNDMYKAVSTIYGIDIQKDNVLESRLRMLEILEAKCDNEKFLSAMADVLEKNIVGGDMLADKWGCDIDGKWIAGYVSNKSGSIEPDNISATHGRIIFYKWSGTWDNPEKVAEFLYDGKDEEPVEEDKIAVESNDDLMARFKNMF